MMFNSSLNPDRQQRLPLRGGVACLLVRRSMDFVLSLKPPMIQPSRAGA
jgi:hypothetical protein